MSYVEAPIWELEAEIVSRDWNGEVETPCLPGRQAKQPEGRARQVGHGETFCFYSRFPC